MKDQTNDREGLPSMREGSRPRPMATIDEVCEYVQIPKSSIYEQRYKGVGLGALGKRVGAHLRWRWSDIEAYFDAQSADVSEPKNVSRGTRRKGAA